MSAFCIFTSLLDMKQARCGEIFLEHATDHVPPPPPTSNLPKGSPARDTSKLLGLASEPLQPPSPQAQATPRCFEVLTLLIY